MTVDEIVDQVLFLKSEKQSMDTISFMGMGEALQNPKVFVALQHLTQLSQISPRRINVSTVGIIPGIVKLTKEFPNVNLAFSLHSPFDEQRSILIPANRLYPLHECLKVLKSHAMITKRRVFLAYLVLVNIF